MFASTVINAGMGVDVNSDEYCVIQATGGNCGEAPRYHHFSQRIFKDKVDRESLDKIFDGFNAVVRERECYFCLRQFVGPLCGLVSITGFILFMVIPMQSAGTGDGSSLIVGIVMGMLLFMGGPALWGIIAAMCLKPSFDNMLLDLRKEAARLDGKYGDLVFTVEYTVGNRFPAIAIKTQGYAGRNAADVSNVSMAMTNMMGAMRANRTAGMTSMFGANTSAAPYATATAVPAPTVTVTSNAVPAATATAISIDAPSTPDPNASAPKMDDDDGSSSVKGGVTKRLQQLADMHASGALTEDEYAAAKRKVLGLDV